MPFTKQQSNLAMQAYGKIPLSFVPNRGPFADSRIAYQSQMQGCRFAFGAGAVAQSAFKPEGQQPGLGTLNRLSGNDKASITDKASD